jgi:hypothetical protein
MDVQANSIFIPHFVKAKHMPRKPNSQYWDDTLKQLVDDPPDGKVKPHIKTIEELQQELAPLLLQRHTLDTKIDTLRRRIKRLIASQK